LPRPGKTSLTGCRFYEGQVAGLGEYFLDSLYSDIDSLQFYAGIHALHSGYHRLLSKRFPFAVYYRVESGIARAKGDAEGDVGSKTR